MKKLHSPSELLLVADNLLASKKKELMRAVVLESITALEAYVHTIVFDALDRKYPSALVLLLKEKTKMDFDSRLSTLVSVATEREINKEEKLWQDYKEAKTIRNKVTHSGKTVSFSEAKSVLNTVYQWLSYLGSTVEVEISLEGLKKHVRENQNKLLKNNFLNEFNLQKIVIEYFATIKPLKTKLENVIFESEHGKKIADIVLEFGKYTVIIELKVVIGDFETSLKSAIDSIKMILKGSPFTRGIVVIYTLKDIPKYYEKVRTIENGSISIVAICKST